MGRPVVHWELMSKEPAKVAAFYEKIFGWKAHEVLGKSVAMMHTEEGIKQFGKVLGDAANGKYEGDLPFQRKSGQQFKGHLQVVATKDRSGRVDSYTGITTEV